ncbi:hypothetical protein ILUMI_03715 [Ignelater luminosus]|uniref:Peptidase aspartic putative domain-containing protein n=1 Tax=Ignelater luminosus TaxID=2038154 RepID=A0A8K0DE53_IGNLU|nr:hypothetical protein ILUMI_03715 [Ignelater luminosus]
MTSNTQPTSFMLKVDSGHSVGHCKSRSQCPKCNRPHNSLLHLDEPHVSETNAIESTGTIVQPSVILRSYNDRPSTSVNTHAAKGTIPAKGRLQSQVLLFTVLIQIKNNDNEYITCRGLLDIGSQSNFITQELCKKLKLTSSKINHVVKGLAIDNKLHFPTASRVINEDFYVYDLLTGGDSEIEILKIQGEVSQILLSVGFQLRKWLCNSKNILQGFQVKDELEIGVLQIGENEANKTLGFMGMLTMILSISRGTTPNFLYGSKLWWHGLEFLTVNNSLWNTQETNLEFYIIKKRLEFDIPEQRSVAVTAVLQHKNFISDLLTPVELEKTIRQNAKDLHDTPAQTVAQDLQCVSSATQGVIPQIQIMKRTIRKTRGGTGNNYSIPCTREDINLTIMDLRGHAQDKQQL